MKLELVNKSKELLYIDNQLTGYEYPIRKKNVKNLIIIFQPWIDVLIRNLYNKNLDPLIKKIINYLNADDSDDSTSGLLLDELSRERNVYINKYEKYLSLDEQNRYLHKIRFLANELKKRYSIISKKDPQIKIK